MADKIYIDSGFRRTQCGDRVIVLSYDTVTSAQLADRPPLKTYVYTETLTLLAGPGLSGGGAWPVFAADLVLFAGTIHQTGGADSPLGIDASGNAPGGAADSGGGPTALEGEAAAGGKNGDPGRSLTIVLGQPPADAQGKPLPVRVRARGGGGGKGQDNLGLGAGSMGGRGGDGGAGGAVRLWVRHPAALWRAQIKDFIAATDEDRRGFVLAALQSSVRTFDQYAAAVHVAGVGTVADAVAGLTTAGAAAHKAALVALDNALRSAITAFHADQLAAIDASGGERGAGGSGNPDGQNGAAGAAGSRSVTVFGAFAELGAGADAPLFIHPEQASMLLERAELLLLAGDPAQNLDPLIEAVATLHKLIDRTTPFSSDAGDPSCQALYGQPETAALLGSDRCAETLASVNASARWLLSQVMSGNDVFGNAPEYVPRESYDFLMTNLSEMLTWYGPLEEAYDTYFKAAGDDEAQQEQLNTVLKDSSSAVASLDAQVKYLDGQLTVALANAQSYDDPLKEAWVAVQEELKKFVDQVKGMFSFDLQKVLASLCTVAFAPESPWMWGSQVAATAYSSVTDVKQLDGSTLPKRYLLRQIDSLGANLKPDELGQALSARSSGELPDSSDGISMVLLASAQLDALIANIGGKVAASCGPLKDAVRAWAQVITDRNKAILFFNALVQLEQAKLAAKQEAKERYDAVETKIAQTDVQPDLPLMSAYVSGLRHRSRQLLLQTLYLTTRALQFTNLDSTNLLAQYLGPVAEVDSSVLGAALTSLKGTYGQGAHNAGAPPQDYPADAAAQGIKVPIPANILKNLQTGRRQFLTIPAVRFGTSSAESPFFGHAAVMVKEVRVWLPGAVVRDGKGKVGLNGEVRVSLAQGGDETVVDSNDAPHPFTHDPVVQDFIYMPGKGAVGLPFPEIKQRIDFTGQDKRYAPVGPFATWQIQIQTDQNPRLDYSKVQEAWMEFHITSYEFKADLNKPAGGKR